MSKELEASRRRMQEQVAAQAERDAEAGRQWHQDYYAKQASCSHKNISSRTEEHLNDHGTRESYTVRQCDDCGMTV